MKISMQLVQLILSKISLDTVIVDYLPGLSDIVSLNFKCMFYLLSVRRI